MSQLDLPNSPRADGHTLIELLLVLALLSIVVLLPALSLVQGLQSVDARGEAQVWQAAFAAGQLEALWSPVDVSVAAGSAGLHFVNGQGADSPFHPAPAFPEVASNVPRWVSSGELVVGLKAQSAAPDSGGSVYFGRARAIRVVVRPESGLTRRASQ